jgi:hypothetical protein
MFSEAELDLGSAVGFNNPQRRTVTADCLGRQARIEPIQGPVERDRFPGAAHRNSRLRLFDSNPPAGRRPGHGTATPSCRVRATSPAPASRTSPPRCRRCSATDDATASSRWSGGDDYPDQGGGGHWSISRVRCRIVSLIRGRCLIALSKTDRARPRLLPA